MDNRSLLKAGLVGTVIAALCCFTPLLVLTLGAIGLASLSGYIDIVMLPALAVFLVILGYALWKSRKTS